MRVVPLLLGLALLGCSPGGASRRPAQAGPCPLSGSFAFVDVTVVPMDERWMLPGHTVLVCDGTITAVGPSARTPVPPGALVIPGQGRFLVPGLTDMHTHLLREEDLLLYLARGVTTVRNMWGAPKHLEWRERVARGALRGPSIVTTGPILDGDKPIHDGSLVVRTAAEAEQAILLHQHLGYDAVKLYSGLGLDALDRLVHLARAAGLPTAGHVPVTAGLEHVLEVGVGSVEHLDGTLDYLLPPDHPLKGKPGWQARMEKVNAADEKRIPALAQELREHNVWSVPTRVVKDALGPPADAWKRVRSPEARFVPPCERALWEPDETLTPEARETQARMLALDDAVIRALGQAGAPLLVGTDPVNPLVIPGFSVHDELQHLVRVGLTPYEALRAATASAGDFLKAPLGTVAVGKRADLLLVDGNPLTDVAAVGRLAGVMARGHWQDAAALEALLDQVAKASAAPPFQGQPELAGDGEKLFAGTYQVTWKDVPFGGERVRVGQGAAVRVLDAQSVDPHKGQEVTVHLLAGAAGTGERLRLESDGAAGRGDMDLTRDGPAARLHGHLLPGPEFRRELSLDPAAVLSVEQMLVGMFLLAPRLEELAVDTSLDVPTAEVGVGSTARVLTGRTQVTRRADGPGGQRIYALRPEQGPSSTLTMDGAGWPLAWELQVYGATVRYQRVP